MEITSSAWKLFFCYIIFVKSDKLKKWQIEKVTKWESEKSRISGNMPKRKSEKRENILGNFKLNIYKSEKMTKWKSEKNYKKWY